MKLLQQLWELAKREGNKRNKSPSSTFVDLGLWLGDITKLDNADYWCTPKNSTTFAGTGGDGVHFGLLHMDGKIMDTSPVVMTVPMMFDRPNIIVGKDLLEFLCLGYDVGYFILEQLAYYDGRQEIIEQIKDHQSQMDDEEQELLQILRGEFHLKPWTNVGVRLNELHQQYHHLLQLKEDS